MNTRVEQIAAATQQITAATTTMNESITEAAAVAEESSASTEQVSASTEETSASTQQVAASAAEMTGSADALRALVGNFQLEIGSSGGSQEEVFAAALEAHEAWNAKLREAIKTGNCPTPIEQARRDDCCTFGKWLHADESFKAAQPDRWQTLHEQHERFHTHAAQVLECAVSGRKEEAERLAKSPEFAEIKQNLSRALTLAAV
jgi:Chemoreceptor zinc-binding domain